MGDGAEIRVTKELRISPSDLSELIVSLGGVKFWIVAMAPLYIGWVLAQAPPDRHLFIDDLRLVLALLVIGPFLSTFTLLVNTYYDMGTTDRLNPRKKYVQVVEELIDPGTLLWAAAGFAGIGLLLSWYVSANFVSYGSGPPGGALTALIGTQGFTLLMGLVVLLSVAYSHPRLRWKGVAGMDLLTNMVGFGVLCPLGGWVLLQPIEAAPWWYFLVVTLFIGAVYAPTTASDHEADRAFGINTLAVRLGVERTLQLGLALLVGAVVLLGVGWWNQWFPFDTRAWAAMQQLWPFVGLQVVFYGVFTRRPTVGKIWALLLLVSIAQGLGVLLMLWGFAEGRGWAPP